MLPVVLKSFVGMRRSYNVFNAIVRRHAAHLQGHIPGLGTVVHLRQNVAMDIDHVDFRGGGCGFDLNRFRRKGKAGRTSRSSSLETLVIMVIRHDSGTLLGLPLLLAHCIFPLAGMSRGWPSSAGL
jgi:hypothetical protein